MADVLSQSQIDALLNSMQNSGAKKPEKEYKKYDFFSPKKYTKDKLKMLSSIYDNYSRIAASQINGLFRVASEVEVMGVEEQRYYEFGNALNESDVLTIADVELPDRSNNPPMLIHINPMLMASMIDRMLGGTGTDMTVDMSYTYTDIELALYAKIIKYLVMITKDVWAGYINLDVSFERIEENPSMFQGISVDETVVIIMLSIKMGEIEGIMNICMPGTLLESIFQVIDSRKHIARGYAYEDNRDTILENIRQSKLPITGQLGTVSLDLDDIYHLKVGDVIDMNKPRNREVKLYVGRQAWFTGKMGIYKKNVAIRINQRLYAEDELEDPENPEGSGQDGKVTSGEEMAL